MTDSAANANIARHLALMAAAHPKLAALKIPRGRSRGRIDYLTLSFAELDAEVAAWSARLAAAGVRRGDRTLVLVRQGLPLIASVFALFRIGAVPVVIDPGMGRENFLACVRRTQPRALVGIFFARLLSRIFRDAFRSVAVRVAASGSLTGRLTHPTSHATPQAVAPACSTASDLAAILFTSGSTGSPKGVCYEHGMFDAQVRLIRATYGIEPGEIDLPLLPIFALFNPALGLTTIVPELDPSRPATLDPAKIVQAIQQEGVTNSFGSPTLWRKIGDHCAAHHVTLPSLRRVLCAGAAVPATLWEQSRTFLPHGQLHSPYGATEALPVASVSADEIDPASVSGACVGRPVPEIDAKIIALSDEPLANLVEAHVLPPRTIGEIVVGGPVVTKAYDLNPVATKLAKIPGASGLWHRMGDCGYFDDEGRLWFVGRKAERVETAAGTLHTEPCEQVFRSHPRAARCALIGLGPRGTQTPALVVETAIRGDAEARALATELRALARTNEHTARIATFFFREKFPVDVRHNAKIHRLTLAQWAATAKGYETHFEA
ncbi:MAG: fatty acid CoA ligase family protein [Opitutaceae bacterium]|nr:fatty acid CoA ligase family protein [Opitutaceae bacterium]